MSQLDQNSDIKIKSVANFTVIDSFCSTYKVNSVLSPRIDGLQSGCCFSNLILSRVRRRSVMNHCRPLMVTTAWLSRPENPSCSYNSQKAFYQILVDFLKKYDEWRRQSHCPQCGLHTRRLTKRLFVEKLLWCLLTKNFYRYNGTGWSWECFVWCGTHVLRYYWVTQVLPKDFQF